MALTFKYGDLDLNPKPLLTIAKEYIKTAANSGLATTYAITLDGHILPDTGVVPPDNHGGLNKVFSGINELKDAFNNDFELLILQCSGDDPIISGYPKITSFNINNASDNYVQRADYSITLELPSLTGSGFDCVGPTGYGDLSSFGIISYSDDFTVEFLEERIGGTGGGFGQMDSVFSITRNVSAQGASLGTSNPDDYKEPWERAQDFLSPKLGMQPEMTGLSGLICPNSNMVNNVRNVSVNKTDGSVSITEAFLALAPGAQAYEDFEASVDTSMDDALISVNINGTVQGVANINYSGCPASGVDNVSKIAQAKSYYQNTVFPRVFSRAKASTGISLSGCHTTADLNKDPVSSSIGYNTVAGTLTYTYTYNNRPVNCVAGACIENISITENEPNDIFSSLTVLGRVSGPVMQAIGTVGPRTREMSIEAVFTPPADCTGTGAGSYFMAPTGYDKFIKNYELTLSGAYTQLFLNSHSKTWDPKTGRFTMNKSWTVGNC